jgi:hypothetical protein
MLFYLYYAKNTFKRYVIFWVHEVGTITRWTSDSGGTRSADQRQLIAAAAEPTGVVPCGDSNFFRPFKKN